MTTISSSEWVLGERDVAIRRTARAGLTAIELDARPGADLAALHGQLTEHSLDVPSLCWNWNPDAELGSPEPGSRLAAQRYLLASLQQAEELGAQQLVVIPSCRTVPWRDEPREVSMERSAEAIREVLLDAPTDVGVSIEALRDDESFLVNTLDEADLMRRLIDDVRVGLLADLYHLAAIPQPLPEVLEPYAGSVNLVHFAAPDRSRITEATPHTGAVIETLRSAGFDGPLTLEYLVPDDDDLRQAAVTAATAWGLRGR